MNGLLLALAAALLPLAAGAEPLVAGAVRDTDGYAVADAAIVARDAGGAVVGRTRTGPDGTFALDVTAPAASLDVDCRYCAPRRVAVGGAPAAVVMVRFAALRDRAPSPDDVAALPYIRAGELLSLAPFVVVGPQGVADRGLEAGRGALLVDGFPAYRIVDGSDLLGLVPAGSVAAVGGAANAIDVATLGDPGASTSGGGDGSTAALRAVEGGAAEALAGSWPGGFRRGTARFATPLGGGALSVAGFAAGSGDDSGGGAAVRYRFEGQHRGGDAALVATDDRSAYGVGGSDLRLDLQLHGGGTLVPRFGAHLRHATGDDATLGVAGRWDEGAIDAGVRYAGERSTVEISVSARRDGAAVGTRTPASAAVLPAIAFAQQLGPRFTLHASSTDVLRPLYLDQLAYGPPTAAAPRSTIDDVGIAYSDDRRLRLEAVAYHERGADPAARIAGAGVSLAWQIAPRLALRAWALDAYPYVPPPAALYGYGYGYAPLTAPLRPAVGWLTYENGLRLDVLSRGNGLDGSIAVPLRAGLRAVIGTYGVPHGRVAAFALRFQPQR